MKMKRMRKLQKISETKSATKTMKQRSLLRAACGSSIVSKTPPTKRPPVKQRSESRSSCTWRLVPEARRQCAKRGRSSVPVQRLHSCSSCRGVRSCAAHRHPQARARSHSQHGCCESAIASSRQNETSLGVRVHSVSLRVSRAAVSAAFSTQGVVLPQRRQPRRG